MASRTQLVDTRIENSDITRRAKIGFLDLGTVADNFVISADFPPILRLNAAGAIDVLMPAVTADMKDMVFFLWNASGFTITLKTSADAAFSPAISIATVSGRMVVCDGTTWRQVI